MRSTRPKNISSIRNGLASTPPISPHCSYELSVYKDSYELFYHKDAVQTPSKYEEAVDKKVSGKWSYFRSLSKSWVGDWNVKQSVTFPLFK